MKSLQVAKLPQGRKQNIAIQLQSGNIQNPNRQAAHVILHQTQATINTIAVLTPGLLQVASIPALAPEPTTIEIHQEVQRQEVRPEEPGLHQSTGATQRETTVAITGQNPAAVITNLLHHEKVINQAVPKPEATVRQAAQEAIAHQAGQAAAPAKAIRLQEAVAPAEVILHHHAAVPEVAPATAPEVAPEAVPAAAPKVAHLVEDDKIETG